MPRFLFRDRKIGDGIIFVGLTSLCAMALPACGSDRATTDDVLAYTAPSYTGEGSETETTEIRLTEITQPAGIEFQHENGAVGNKWMPETMGSGVAFFDYDNDGWPDILLINGSSWTENNNEVEVTPKLYRNLGDGRFSDVTNETGLNISVYGMGVAAADYDGDRDIDIYITAVGDNLLLRNDAGRFVDVTGYAGVDGNPSSSRDYSSWSTAAAWVDYDRDGYLDLFTCNYVKWTAETDLHTTLDGVNKSYATPEQYEGDSCRLYKNVDGSRFSDYTARAGVENRDGKTLGVAVADINRDGWPDLIVANDTERNFLYVSNGDGTFTDKAVQAGVGYDEFGRARAGMGIDVADLAGTGELSIVIGNFSHEPLSLYTLVSDGLFQDMAGLANLTRASTRQLTFGLAFVDLDLDADVDLITGNGHIEPDIGTVQQGISFAQSPQIFLNDGNRRFTEATSLVGGSFDEPIVARGVAYADIDRDGDWDLLISTNGDRPKLFRNDLPHEATNWIALKPIGVSPNTQAIGAIVTVYADGREQSQMVRTGSSYLSQSDIGTLIFGLGEKSGVDSVLVRWPTSGKLDNYGPASSGRRYVVREGSISLKTERD